MGKAFSLKEKGTAFYKAFFNFESLEQFGRYVITGLLSLALDFLLLYACTEFLGFWYLYSKVIAFTVVFWFNFLLNRYWSFRSRGPLRRQLLLYGLLCGFNLAVSGALLYYLTESFGLPYLVSNVFVVGLIVLWNFILYKRVIYR
jgi:putative flippase GtrA